MRSGTGEGPGICRKWRPVGWKSSVSINSLWEEFCSFFAYKIHLSSCSIPTTGFTWQVFAYKISRMTADIISIPRAALHEQVAHRLRQMLVENRIAPGAKLNERELAE